MNDNVITADFQNAGVGYVETAVGFIAHSLGISSGSLGLVLDIKDANAWKLTSQDVPAPAGILDDLGRVHGDFWVQARSLYDLSVPETVAIHPMAFATHAWNWKLNGMTLEQAVEMVEDRLEWEAGISDDHAAQLDEAQHAAASLLPNGSEMWERRNMSTVNALVRLAGYTSNTLGRLLRTHRGNARRMMSGHLLPSSAEIGIILEELADTQDRAWQIFVAAREGEALDQINGVPVDGGDIGAAWMICMESSPGLLVRESIAALYPRFVKSWKEAA